MVVLEAPFVVVLVVLALVLVPPLVCRVVKGALAGGEVGLMGAGRSGSGDVWCSGSDDDEVCMERNGVVVVALFVP